MAATVTDPELPTLTLADLGVLRDARIEDDGTVVVEITPTYTGCPAMGASCAPTFVHALHRAGFGEVRTVLAPAWSTDWISEEGRRLAAGGIAPPGKAPVRAAGPVPLNLSHPPDGVLSGLRLGRHRGASEFGATACKALRRACRSCSASEPSSTSRRSETRDDERPPPPAVPSPDRGEGREADRRRRWSPSTSPTTSSRTTASSRARR